MILMAKKANSLSHTKWMCKYHIVFTPKSFNARPYTYAGKYKHANLKYKFGNRHFWAEGYYVSTVGLNEATIKKYIQEQETHDIAMDKLSVREYGTSFKGSE